MMSLKNPPKGGFFISNTNIFMLEITHYTQFTICTINVSFTSTSNDIAFLIRYLAFLFLSSPAELATIKNMILLF